MLLKADYLNEHCHCSTLNKEKLEYPQYFSEQPHFLSRGNFEKIGNFIRLYEAALQTQTVRGAFVDDGIKIVEKGIFNSYDFHIGETGPQLIEINTNAAGAVLALNATSRMQSCCDGLTPMAQPYRFDENQIVRMFLSEFAQRFPGRQLRTVAIVDEKPHEQFFYPEFLLAAELLRRHGIEAVVVPPEAISIANQKVYAGEIRLDLIYNRLTDFALLKPEHAVLKDAYEQGLVTVSPNPALHALYARKSNLAAFWSHAFDTVPEIERIRAHLPETRLVAVENRDALWHDRRQWFFKPVNGFGGKAVYRGDKLTRKVWAGIAPGEYIAQKYVPPTTRQLKANLSLKYDLRVYTYGDEILGMMARYYQGQATNFRTEHGGLASVMLAA